MGLEEDSGPKIGGFRHVRELGLQGQDLGGVGGGARSLRGAAMF